LYITIAIGSATDDDDDDVEAIRCHDVIDITPRHVGGILNVNKDWAAPWNESKCTIWRTPCRKYLVRHCVPGILYAVRAAIG